MSASRITLSRGKFDPKLKEVWDLCPSLKGEYTTTLLMALDCLVLKLQEGASTTQPTDVGARPIETSSYDPQDEYEY